MISVRGCSLYVFLPILRLRKLASRKQWERHRKAKPGPRLCPDRDVAAFERSDRIVPWTGGTENDNRPTGGFGDETFRTRRLSAVIARMTKTWTVSGFTGLLVLVPVTVCVTITYVNSNEDPSRCNDRSNNNRSSNSKQNLQMKYTDTRGLSQPMISQEIFFCSRIKVPSLLVKSWWFSGFFLRILMYKVIYTYVYIFKKYI